jgi:hypothetical protein
MGAWGCAFQVQDAGGPPEHFYGGGFEGTVPTDPHVEGGYDDGSGGAGLSGGYSGY